MKGKHDDLIMAIAMALYVGENSFSQLQKADSLTKAMLDGWTSEASDNPSIQPSTPIFGISGRNEVGREQLITTYEEVEIQDNINVIQDFETTRYSFNLSLIHI